VDPKKRHFGRRIRPSTADNLAVAAADELSAKELSNASAAVDMSQRQGSNLALVSSWLVGLCAVVAVTRACVFYTGSMAVRGRDGDHGAVQSSNRRNAPMRKISSWTVVYCAILAAGLLMATTVQARPNYLQWWIKTYPSVAKKNEVKTAVKCGVCHGPGGDKTVRNDYGKAIAKALDGKKNIKKADKSIFDDALKTAADQKSGTEGKTFGDLLNADELPK
jgi:hypothetical protein